MNIPLKLIVEDVDVNSFEYLVEEKNSSSDPKYYIKGPMILLDEKNQNGRIYESDEMQPAVEAYIKEFVETGRALSELEHPSCFTENADILTESGWKNIVDVQEGENVLTLDPETKEIVTNPVKKKIDEEYTGKLYRIKGRNIDFIVTPNHRFPLQNRKGGIELVDIETIKNNFKKYRHAFIPKLGLYTPSIEESDVFVLKGLPIQKQGNFKNDVTKDVNINYKTFMGFMGIWLAEGHLQNRGDRNQYGGSNVVISQRKEHNKEIIRKLLKEFPEDLQWGESTDDKGTTSFYLSDVRLFNYLKPLGDCYSKYIPNELKTASPQLLEELLYWFNVGDGRYYSSDEREYNVKNVFTTSKRLIDDLHEILIKSGGSGNIRTIITEADYYFADHLIKAENKVPLYQLNFSRTKGIYTDDRFLSIEEVDNTWGRVYCITVDNETFYARENGKSCWSGNCPDVNLERACDRMVSLVKEGNSYIGKAVCLSTPMGKLQESLIRDGVKLGKSTRCLGQLVENNGVNYVKTPNIRAIDTVHNPSGQSQDRSCFMNGILENKEFIVNYNQYNERIYDEFERSVGNLPRKQVEQYLTEQIMKFIQNLR